MSNYPSGMSASDWRHIENPDAAMMAYLHGRAMMGPSEDICPSGHRTLAFTGYLHGRAMRWLECGTCAWSTAEDSL